MADPQLDRLKSQLLSSGMAQKNNALYQVLDQLIGATQKISNTLSNLDLTPAATVDQDQEYLTAQDETATLPNSRELLAGDGVTFDDAVANERTVDVPSSQAEILTGADETASLPNSRELLAGAGVTFDDSVANQRSIAIASGTGFLTGTGNPHGVVTAGIGVFYVDTVTGYCYQKVGGTGTAYGWYLIRPVDGAGLEGPLPIAMHQSGVNTATAALRTNGYGGFMPSVADAVDTLSPTSVTSLSINYVSGVPYKTFTCAATTNTVMYYNAGGVSFTGRQFLDTDLDVWMSMRTGSDITTNRWWFGIAPNAITNSDTWGTGSSGALLFRYSTAAGDGGWIGQSCINGAANHSETATVNTIAANTNYKLRIRFVRSGTPTVYFSVNDGTEVSLTTNIPPTGVAYTMLFGVTTLANSARSFGLKSMGGWWGAQ